MYGSNLQQQRKQHQYFDESSSINNEHHFIQDDDGIVIRAIHDLFMAKKRHASGSEVVIHATFIEIYNDRVFDLLGYKKSNTTTSISSINSSMSLTSGKGVSSIRLKTPQHARQVIQNALKRKSKSRSHTICTLNVTINPAVNRSVTSGKLSYITSTDVISAKLTLVDLAGNINRTKQSNSTQQSRCESSIVNKDLYVLSQCISALAEKSDKNKRSNHVPFRDSKLTSILRGSLGGNCCTVMVACISPAQIDLEESLNTLKYATRTRNITNRVKKNLIKTTALTAVEGAALRRENKVLRSQLLDLTKKYQFLRRSKSYYNADHDENCHNSINCDQDKIEFSSESQKWRLKFEKLKTVCLDVGLSTAVAELDAKDEALLVSHRTEVLELKEQIQQLINGQCDDTASVTSCLTMETFDFGDGNSCTSSASMLSSLANKSLKSDYIGRTKLMEIEDKKLEARIQEKKSVLSNMDRNNILKASALKLKLEKEQDSYHQRIKELDDVQNELKESICTLKDDIEVLKDEKEDESHEQRIENLNGIRNELEQSISVLKNDIEVLKDEKSTVSAKVEVLQKEVKLQESNLNQINQIVDGVRNQMGNLRNEQKIVENDTKKLEDRKHYIVNEIDRLKSELRLLTKEKLDLCDEVEDLQNASNLVKEFSQEQIERQKCEEELQIKSNQCKVLRDERDSLQSKLADSKESQQKDKLKAKNLGKEVSLLANKLNTFESRTSKPLQERKNNDSSNTSKKPPLPSPMHKKIINSSSNSVAGSVVSTISISNFVDLQTDDDTSILFGDSREHNDPDQSIQSCFSENSSLNPEGVAVRLHARKLLFWANKSIARNTRSDANLSLSMELDNESSYCSFIDDKENNFPGTRGRTMQRSQSRVHNTSMHSRSPSPFIVRHNEGCSCHESLFSGRADHTEFFLPRLGLACNCGAEEVAQARNTNPTAVKSFLRLWQSKFLKSVGITTAKHLIKNEKYNGKEIARAMKLWRHKNAMKPARTKSCLVALQIWSKVAKTVVQSASKKAKEEEEAAFDTSRGPLFLEFGKDFNDDNSFTSLSTLGNNGSMQLLDDSFSLKEGEYEI